MKRTLFLVRPDLVGWRIECGDRIVRVDTVDAAICNAHQLAGHEHRAHSTPTAVAVEYTSGDATLLGRHG